MEEFGDPEYLREKHARPIYLRLMNENACQADHELLLTVRLQAGQLNAGEVERLLLGGWRSGVMGAWYAIAYPRSELNAPVHRALRASKGSLTALPLLVAVMTYFSEDSIPAIADYERADQVNDWGAGGVARATAAILSQRLGIPNPLQPGTSEDRRTMEELWGVAQQLQRAR